MFTAIVRFSIKKKLFVGLTTLFLFIGGIYAMLTLPIDAVPDITNNQVQIVTVSPTLAPQEVEQLITMPIEIAMSNIMNVEDIRSVSRFGLSVVTVVFKESVPTLDARQLINEQIQSVTSEIPSELGYHDSGCQTRWITAFHSQIHIGSFHIEIRKERSIQTCIIFPPCINQSVRDTFTQRPCGFNSACNGSYLHKIGACPRNNCYFHIVSTLFGLIREAKVHFLTEFIRYFAYKITNICRHSFKFLIL